MTAAIPAIRTLVVDDSEEFLIVASRWVASQDRLQLAGTARSGREAIEAVDRLGPDLVLMDVAMPGMSGFEATRLLKKRDARPWIVILSFFDNHAARDEAWAAGADGFVAKADVGARLLPVIRSLFGEIGQVDEFKPESSGSDSYRFNGPGHGARVPRPEKT